MKRDFARFRPYEEKAYGSIAGRLIGPSPLQDGPQKPFSSGNNGTGSAQATSHQSTLFNTLQEKNTHESGGLNGRRIRLHSELARLPFTGYLSGGPGASGRGLLWSTAMNKPPLRVLHTSDWHIGRTLYGRKRYESFAAFLLWLGETIREERVDVLVVAGDVFDTSAPSNRSQELYYRFLCRIREHCRHVVIVAGNHDSPSFLAAPKELLRALNVHVIGAMSDDPAEETLVLRGRDGEPELIVCAVPYLRDRDIRTSEAGESLEDKEAKLLEGIRRHYAAVCALAASERSRPDLPLLATGHLFAAGGLTQEGDGVRQLYVGSLARVGADCFPDCIDYLALGHLHIPQKLGGSETRRYSGSPLPMNFGERTGKSACLVDFTGRKAAVRCLPVPCFQALERVEGDWGRIESRLKALAGADAKPWLEIVYTGAEVMSDLRDRLEKLVDGTGMELIRVKNARLIERALHREDADSLDALDVHEVFERCLAAHEVPEEQRPELRRAYQETVASLLEADARAE